jgi:hypothetical protein
LAAVCALCVAGSAAAKEAAVQMPSQAAIDAMSDQDFRAFLAGPALRIRAGTPEERLVAPTGHAAPCPEVKNQGSQPKVSIFDRTIRLILAVMGVSNA